MPLLAGLIADQGAVDMDLRVIKSALQRIHVASGYMLLQRLRTHTIPNIVSTCINPTSSATITPSLLPLVNHLRSILTNLVGNSCSQSTVHAIPSTILHPLLTLPPEFIGKPLFALQATLTDPIITFTIRKKVTITNYNDLLSSILSEALIDLLVVPTTLRLESAAARSSSGISDPPLPALNRTTSLDDHHARLHSRNDILSRLSSRHVLASAILNLNRGGVRLSLFALPLLHHFLHSPGVAFNSQKNLHPSLAQLDALSAPSPPTQAVTTALVDYISNLSASPEFLLRQQEAQQHLYHVLNIIQPQRIRRREFSYSALPSQRH